MGIREKRNLVKRDLVLEQAGPLFYRYGYEYTSMKSIAEGCNLGMNAIYSVFGSKEQICAELFLQAQQEFVGAFKQILAGSDLLPVNNRAIMDLYIDFYSRHNFLYEIVWLVISGQIQAELKTGTVELIHDNFIDLLDSYSSYLEKLQHSGAIGAALDLKKLTAAFWCMMSGLASNYIHKTGEVTGVSNNDIRELELDMVLKILQYDPKEESAASNRV